MCCETRQDKIKSCGITFIIVGIFAIGISDVILYATGHKYYKSTCKDPSGVLINHYNVSSDPISFTDDIWNIARWNYKSFHTLSFWQVCPTIKHDTEMYYHDSLIARGDRKIFSLESKTYINDCQDHRLYTIQAKSTEDAFINLNGYYVKVAVYNKDGHPIGYSQSVKFYSESVQIYSYPEQELIIDMNSDFLSIPRTWKMDFKNLSNPLADLRLATIVAGYTSFSPQPGHNDTTDLCNNYFYYSSILMLVIAGIIGLVILCGLCILGYFIFKEGCSVIDRCRNWCIKRCDDCSDECQNVYYKFMSPDSIPKTTNLASIDSKQENIELERHISKDDFLNPPENPAYSSSSGSNAQAFNQSENNDSLNFKKNGDQIVEIQFDQ